MNKKQEYLLNESGDKTTEYENSGLFLESTANALAEKYNGKAEKEPSGHYVVLLGETNKG
jgi:hypothetical protein